MTNERGGPLMAATVRTNVLYYKTAALTEKKGLLTHKDATAYVYSLTSRSAETADNPQLGPGETTEFVALTNLALHPSNLIIQPESDTAVVYSTASSKSGGVPAAGNTPLWLVAREGQWWRVASRLNGLLDKDAMEPPPMTWSDKQQFLENLRDLSLIVLVSPSSTHSLKESDRVRWQAMLEAAQTIAVPETYRSAKLHVSFKPAGASLDELLSETAFAAAMPSAILLYSEQDCGDTRIADYTISLLQARHIRLYAPDTQTCRQNLERTVSLTNGRFLPPGSPATPGRLEAMIKQLIDHECKHTGGLHETAMRLVQDKSLCREAYCNDLSELLHYGFKATPVTWSPPPCLVATTEGTPAFYDQPSRLLGALSSLKVELSNMLSTTRDHPEQIMHMYVALANVFDLGLEPRVQQIFNHGKNENYIEACVFLQDNLRALPYLPSWARELVEKEWRSDFRRIMEQEINPLLSQIEHQRNLEHCILPIDGPGP
ncbi:MAG: hypothetical protein EOM20_04110 [Spartobacteria bacterium]|nr:hypothetical protein [Spartobacteria bacterium]